MTVPRPEGAPGDLVVCPECEGRWYGDTCPVCGSWGVVHIGQYAEIEALRERAGRVLGEFDRLCALADELAAPLEL